MIKQNWNIGSEEKSRILALHESATKKLYLMGEQNLPIKTDKKSWQLCENVVTQDGDKFYILLSNGVKTEIPRLSQISGTISGRNLNLSPITQNGIDVGSMMKQTNTCSNKFPQSYKGNVQWICYFDDISQKLVGTRGNEKMVVKNEPVYGVISFDGSLGTGGGDFMDIPTQKDKNGVVIQYGVSRSKSFIFEVSIAMVGKEIASDDKIAPEQGIEPETEPKPKSFELNIESPFIFDQTNLTPEAENYFKTFVENIKKNYQGVTGDVQVITSSSIDGAGKENYDMKLSDNRAKAIIEKLRSALPEIKLNFLPKPIGQTDQFAPGKTYLNGFNKEQTAPNRRLIIKLPKITK